MSYKETIESVKSSATKGAKIFKNGGLTTKLCLSGAFIGALNGVRCGLGEQVTIGNVITATYMGFMGGVMGGVVGHIAGGYLDSLKETPVVE